ncbi:unnamed protein product [Meloidogyne enterolobii]|uniref:Uncharacterized protein n=1 Tax=Meloidogyne enterolobii TaxID=390850 RepID=A0ACB0ZAI1_MELEN
MLNRGSTVFKIIDLMIDVENTVKEINSIENIKKDKINKTKNSNNKNNNSKKQRKKKNKIGKTIKPDNSEDDNQNKESVEEINNEDSKLQGKIIEEVNNELDDKTEANEREEDEDEWIMNKKDLMKKRKEDRKKIREAEIIRKLKIKDEKDIKSLLTLNNRKKMNLKSYLNNNDITMKNILEDEIDKDKKEKNEDLIKEKIEDLGKEENEELNKNKKLNEENKQCFGEKKNEGLEENKEINEDCSHLLGPDDQNLISSNLNKKEKIEISQTNFNKMKININENNGKNNEEKADIINQRQENNLKQEEKKDNALVPVNEVISKENHKDFKSFSKFTPFQPKTFLEEKALFEAYEKFIGGKGDPKKIIPALECGVIIDEIKQRFVYVKKFKQDKIDVELNCEENKNSSKNLTGSLGGRDLILECYLLSFFTLSLFSPKM